MIQDDALDFGAGEFNFHTVLSCLPGLGERIISQINKSVINFWS
jgi:hypothetical protein